MNEKQLKTQIRSLRKKIDELSEKNERIEMRYNNLRSWVLRKFDWFVDISAEGKSPCLKYLIREIRKLNL